ncbi:MAG: acyltransferase [Treponema sp.]|jgi:1-acyl-sn-glycerol-3-phosphate acyltransferase|nr:acyltransferase [Treponema sp.]
MYKPYIKPIVKAAPDIRVPEPRISKFVLLLLKFLARPYLLTFIGRAKIILRGENYLFDAFKRALAKESRCIIAFRHAIGAEPQLLAWFFLFRFNALARKAGIKFPCRPHALFIYGYEVARWGGWVARFFMPRIGAMPIHHTKLDRQGMSRILNAIVEGPYPVALAPEGQVSYTAESVPRLEPGTFWIGFNAADRINKQGSNIPVEVLPLSIYSRFGAKEKSTLETLIRKIEAYTNISGKEARALPLTKRLELCREHILEVNENRYEIKSDKNIPFENRLDTVINTALETGERMLGIKGEGDFFTRLYYLRQICWDLIILPGVDSLDNMTPAKRSTADLRAGEAWYASRHMELADLGWYFRVPLPQESDPLHIKTEYCQNLYDFANRTMGGAFGNRKNILPQRVIIQAAPVINLTERLPSYKADKRAAMDTAMKDLEKTYLDSIQTVNQEEI